MAVRSANSLTSFGELLSGLRAEVGFGMEPADLLTAVLDRTGYRAELEASDDPQDGSRLENLDQLVSVLRENTENLVAGRALAVAVEHGVGGSRDRRPTARAGPLTVADDDVPRDAGDLLDRCAGTTLAGRRRRRGAGFRRTAWSP